MDLTFEDRQAPENADINPMNKGCAIVAMNIHFHADWLHHICLRDEHQEPIDRWQAAVDLLDKLLTKAVFTEEDYPYTYPFVKNAQTVIELLLKNGTDSKDSGLRETEIREMVIKELGEQIKTNSANN